MEYLASKIEMYRNDDSLVRMLLGNMIDLCEASDASWESPACWAVKQNRPLVLDLICKVGDHNDRRQLSHLLYIAIFYNRPTCLCIITKYGVNPNGNEHSCPLAIAACRGYLGCVSVLISAGAVLSPSSSVGRWTEDSPVMAAARHGHAKCLALLIKNGADFKIVNEYGESCLSVAMREGHKDCVDVVNDVLFSNESICELQSSQTSPVSFPTFPPTVTPPVPSVPIVQRAPSNFYVTAHACRECMHRGDLSRMHLLPCGHICQCRHSRLQPGDCPYC